MSKYNPKWEQNSKLYKINFLAFAGEWQIKNSDLIKEFLMPFSTMEDFKNPQRDYLWSRYKYSALYVNYPNQYLKQALGLATRKGFEISLPQSMKKYEDYATLDNLSLESLFNDILTSVIKYGSALLVPNIVDEMSTATDLPRLELIPGSDVLDGETVYDKQKNVDVFKRVVYYKQEYKFNFATNSYNVPEIYIYVKGLDVNGNYYEAKMKESNYSNFNLLDPIQSKDVCESLSFPVWNSQINFVPVVYINKNNLKLEWNESPIQNLIDVALAIFSLNADLRFLLSQQSSSTLVISGTDLESKGIKTGCGAVINLVDNGSKAEYIAPNTSGLSEMNTQLVHLHEVAKQQLLSLVDVGKDASGEALSLRISDKTSELVALVENVCRGLTRELELIGQLIGENIDQIDFQSNINLNFELNSEEKI